MTVERDPSADDGYDLFISYRSAKSGAHAVAVRDALYALDKRHPGSRSIRIFLDRISLRTGGLDAHIANGLRKSRHLVVLIDETTVRSPWVDKEVRDWLDAGGAPDRLFLMRTSSATDLSWNGDTGRFARPDSLPEALRDAFVSEQKYIDFVVPPRRVNEVDLIGLYASVMAADPEAMGEDERRHLQKQRRRNRIFTTILAALLAGSLIAGTLAVSNFLRADESARQARADALGAEGLLTLPVAPDRAIDQAVEASRLGSGTSIRSALLATASDTRRLQGTFSLSRDGGAASLAGVSLSPEARTLTAWGPDTGGGSIVVTWETTNRDVMQRFSVPEETITSLIEVPGVAYLACTPERALKVDWHTYETVVLHPAHAGCTAEAYLGGGVAEIIEADASHRLVGVTIDGRGIDHSGSLVPGPRETTWRLVTRGRLIIAVLTPKGVVDLDAQAQGSLASADSDTFMTKGQRGYRMFSVSGTKLSQTAPTLPADVTAVAGWRDYRNRHRVIWATASGTMGWTGGPETLTVGGGRVQSGQLPFLTRYEGDYQSDNALLIVGARVSKVTMADDRLTEVPLGTRSSSTTGASKLGASTCGGRNSVILDEAAYVTADALDRKITAAGRLIESPAVLRNCHAVEAGPPIRIDGNLVAESAFANLNLTDIGPQGELALAREDGSISYFSGLDNDMVPWSITPSLGSILAPDGATILRDGEPPTLESATGITEVVAGGAWTRPSPDGRGGILVDDNERRWLAIAGEIPQMLAPDCTQESFEPGADFMSNLDEARTPRLVGSTDGRRVNCLTGDPVPTGPTILAYVASGGLSYVVSREAGTVRLTTWRAGDTTPTTRDLPGTHSTTTFTAVGATGDRVIISGGDSPELLEFRWDGTEFRAGQRFAMSVGPPATLAYSPDESLLIAVTADRRFDVFDTFTGRLLASHTQAVESGAYTGLVVLERDGFLLAFLYDTSDTRSGTLIRIPVGIPQLKDLLCRVHRAPSC